MSWTNELLKIYEIISKLDDDKDDSLIPIFHTRISKSKKQIEITLDSNGNFKDAKHVDNDFETIYPEYQCKTNARNPRPLADDLQNLSGDWDRYVKSTKNDNNKYYTQYLTQLKNWNESDFSHPAVSAVYRYITKGELLTDLIKKGVISIKSNKTETPAQLSESLQKDIINHKDTLVRFSINYDDFSRESRTWKDKELYTNFIKYNSYRLKKEENTQLCYATGQLLPVMKVHPYARGKAKLISSNDDKGFTFRGRFTDATEALSVSYDFSYKIHNSLKWLDSKQGISCGTLRLIPWASALEEIPKEFIKDDNWNDEQAYDTLPLYKAWLSKYIMGYRQKYHNNTKIMLLGLDEANPGRLSIALYEELQSSEFLKNLESWHEKSAWIRMRYDENKYQKLIKSFSLFEIINYAYGTEPSKGAMKFEDNGSKLLSNHIIRLLPCVTQGRPVPHDLIVTLYNRASNPLAYKQPFNHRVTVEVACGMIRAWKKGAITMGYDPKEKNRSYLYGCLLAIADKAEKDVYNEDDRGKRVTNARRYWANFSRHPYRTWGVIEERLRPYLDQNRYSTTIEKQIQEITEKFTPFEFQDNRPLEPLYLLGYHHFTAFMYSQHKEENK